MTGKTPAESVSTVTLVMQLIHANSAGFIHGGEIMKLVDTAAGVASMGHSNGRVVTVEVDSLTANCESRIANRPSADTLARGPIS